jgi:WD40 repeat protein
MLYANTDGASAGMTIYSSQNGAIQSHLEGIHDFVFSPDEKLVAFTSYDKVALWDLHTGGVQTILNEGYINDIEFSPDGTLLAAWAGTFEDPRYTIVWDAQTGDVRAKLEDSFSVTFSQNNQLLTCRADHPTAEVWSIHADTAEVVLTQNQLECNAAYPGGGPNFLFSQDGAYLAGWNEARIVVWNVQTGEIQVTLEQTSAVRTSAWIGSDYLRAIQWMPVAFSPDGTLLASVDADTIRLWDIRTGAVQAVLIGHKFPEGAIAFSPDGRLLAFSEKENKASVNVWDLQTGNLALVVGTNPGWYMQRPAAFAFSPDSNLLAIASEQIPSAIEGMSTSGVQIWNVQTGQVLATFEMRFPSSTVTLDLLMFSHDATSLVAAPDVDGKLHVFGLIGSSVERSGVSLTPVMFSPFSDVIPSAWLAVDPIPARYEIRFQDQSTEAYTCSYIGNNNVVYYQQIITVTITDLQTNEQIASRTFSGAGSSTCPATQEFAVGGGVTLVETNEASVSEFETWLKRTMSAYGLN